LPSITPALPRDAQAISRVHTKSWQHAYRGIFADDYLDGLDWRDRLEFWTNELTDRPEGHLTLVARGGDSLLGFASAGPARDADLATGFAEIYAIYVDPVSWSQGIGSSLLEASIDLLSTTGPGGDAVTLWVLEANRQARSFYRARGFKPDGATAQVERGGVSAADLRYCRSIREPNQYKLGT
jgi:ribosomal protein S18 acetylase RimI-like enzyme